MRPRSKAIASGVLVGLIGLSILGALAQKGLYLLMVLFMAGSPVNTVIESWESPDGERTAVLFVRGAGATTRDTLHLSVLDSSDLPPTSAGNLLILGEQIDPEEVSKETPVRIEWINARFISVDFPQDTKLIKANNELYPLRIEYCMYDRRSS